MALLDIQLPATTGEAGQWPDLTDPEPRTALTPAALKAFAQLGDRWHATVPDLCALLGGISESSWHAWRRTPPAALSVDQLTRVSLLLGVYTALHALHAGPLADEWVTRPNTHPIFAGRTPLAAMSHGGIPVMLEVRALLDGRRGGL